MKIGKKTKIEREMTRTERNRKNNLRRITVATVVAFIIFIALIIIQSSILNQEDKIRVYQVKSDIESGTKLTDENIDKFLTFKDVAVSLIPSDYITDSSVIIGKFVNRNYKAKDIITTDGLVDTQQEYESNIKNPVEVSFNTDSLGISVSGTIREGDYINIYGLRRKELDSGSDDVWGTNQSNLYTVDETYTFKHVYITKAFDASGVRIVTGKSNEDVTCTMFNIIIDEKDAELFNEMIINCNLRLAKVMYETDTDYQAFLKTTNATAAEATVNKNKQSGQTKATEIKPGNTYFWETESTKNSEESVESDEEAVENDEAVESDEESVKNDESEQSEKSEQSESNDDVAVENEEVTE